MSGLGRRLGKLEALAPVGCPTCRAWCGIVLADDAGDRTRPERCMDCGRLVPVRSLVTIVGVPLAAL